MKKLFKKDRYLSRKSKYIRNILNVWTKENQEILDKSSMDLLIFGRSVVKIDKTGKLSIPLNYEEIFN